MSFLSALVFLKCDIKDFQNPYLRLLLPRIIFCSLLRLSVNRASVINATKAKKFTIHYMVYISLLGNAQCEIKFALESKLSDVAVFLIQLVFTVVFSCVLLLLSYSNLGQCFWDCVLSSSNVITHLFMIIKF